LQKKEQLSIVNGKYVTIVPTSCKRVPKIGIEKSEQQFNPFFFLHLTQNCIIIKNIFKKLKQKQFHPFSIQSTPALPS
jgi:hypothetical protein